MNAIERVFKKGTRLNAIVAVVSAFAIVVQLALPLSAVAQEVDPTETTQTQTQTQLQQPEVDETPDHTEEGEETPTLEEVIADNEPAAFKIADPNAADLSIDKKANNHNPRVGDQFNYRLIVKNNGPATVENAIVHDVLPAGMNFVSAVNASEYDETTGVWTVGELADDETAELIITVEVDPSIEGQSVKNTAEVDIDDTAAEAVFLDEIIAEDVHDPNPGNNKDSIIVKVRDGKDKGLDLQPVCSPDPNTQLRWKVNNPSDGDVPFTWKVQSTGEEGAGVAMANGDTFFFTTTDLNHIHGPVRIFWFGDDDKEYHDLSENPGKQCDDEPCKEGPAFAGSVVSSDQGAKGDDSLITDPSRTNPDNTLGAPDNSFFSLGKGGEVVVKFDGYVLNVVGDDLSFHEITNDRNIYPEEKASVDVSEDGVNWFNVGTVSSTSVAGVSYLDFGPTGLGWIQYVRMTDTTNFAIHTGDADGYDVDAIDATDTSCTPPPCEAGHVFANSVIDSAQGTQKGGAPVNAGRTDPLNALGAPDNAFFSLGTHGVLTIAFSQFVMNVDGDDLSFHEITNGRNEYPEERASVEVSQDGSTWFAIGSVSSLATDGIDYLDFDSTGLDWIRYVRMTDTTNFGPHTDAADGYDVDAIDATYAACARLDLDKHGEYDSATGIITFKIDWSVVGNDSVDNVQITDPLPAGTTFVSADNGGFLDVGNVVVWNLGTKNPGDSGTVTVVVSLTLGDLFGSSVVGAETLQGTQKGGAAVALDRSDANQALGAPESTGIPYDVPPVPGKFFSLGFNGQGDGGYLTVGFASPIIDGPGNDVKVFEVTYPEVYPDEKINVKVSSDLLTWTDLGLITRDGGVDFVTGGVTSANYVKVTDVSNKADFDDTADGYDVDAIQALHYTPPICDVTNVAYGTWSFGDKIYFGTANTAVVTINRERCDGGEQPLEYVDPGVVKTVDDETPAPGATIVYTITVTNHGTITATNVTVTDSLPSGVSYVSDDGAGAYDNGTHVWTIPSLAAGASVTLHITATVTAEEETVVINTATVDGSTPTDNNLSNNTDDATITVTDDGGDGGDGDGDGDGGGSSSSRSSGSSSNGGDDDGQVLGDSTTAPVTPSVLGAATELPRTGFPLIGLAAAMGFASFAAVFGKKEQPRVRAARTRRAAAGTGRTGVRVRSRIVE